MEVIEERLPGQFLRVHRNALVAPERMRELRKDPTLRGQLVLRLTIEPDGSVSMCELHSASMDAPDLAAQVVNRVKTFDFGAKEDIVAITIIYPIDFLPAG